MSSSQKLAMNRADRSDQPIAGPNVSGVALVGKQDLSDWIELMEAVEALCQEWPAQAGSIEGSFKL
jgi:hypothetical protein